MKLLIGKDGDWLQADFPFEYCRAIIRAYRNASFKKRPVTMYKVFNSLQPRPGLKEDCRDTWRRLRDVKRGRIERFTVFSDRIEIDLEATK